MSTENTENVKNTYHINKSGHVELCPARSTERCHTVNTAGNFHGPLDEVSGVATMRFAERTKAFVQLEKNLDTHEARRLNMYKNSDLVSTQVKLWKEAFPGTKRDMFGLMRAIGIEKRPKTRDGRYNFNGVNFAHADLSGLDLSYATFTGADFFEANLTDTLFRNSRFTKTIFDKAACTNTDFLGSKLFSVSFSEADLSGAYFGKTDMEDVSIFGAHIKENHFPLGSSFSNVPSHLVH